MSSVRIELPERFRQGITRSLSGAAEFIVVPVADGALDVAPMEGAGVTRKYLRSHLVARASTDIASDEAWAFLAAHPPDSPKPQIELPPGTEDYGQGPSLRALIQGLVVDVGLAEVDALPDLFRERLPGLFERYPHGSLWYLSVDSVLLARLAFMRIALQLQLTPDAKLGEGEGDRSSYFNVHQESGGVNFASVTTPALLAFAPVVSGFTMSAMPHGFVFLFGALEGEQDMRTRNPHSLARGFFPSVNAHVQSPGIKAPVDDLKNTDVETLLTWWVSRLNVVYSHMADPTRYRSATGEHLVAAQAAWHFTFERMIADVVGLAVSVDSPALLRMQTAFDALDKIAALLGESRADSTRVFQGMLERRTSLPRMQRALDGMPLQLRHRFSTWAESAFGRLYADVAKNTMASRKSDIGVTVGFRDATDLHEVTWDEYVGRLIREARNASHGLLDILTEPVRTNYNPAKHGPRRVYLLATNSGEIPASFFEVIHVLLFALMADAEALCDRSW